MKINRLFIAIFCFITVFATPVANSVEIVRLQMEYGGAGIGGAFDFPKVTRTLDLELYDDVTPNTVANFLNYVNDSRYDGMLISRSEPGFVIQTGGYTFRPPDPANDALLPIGTNGSFVEEVPKDPTIANEFNLSNVRGTLAMAKLGGDPDSASSEWFINLVDNSFLDTSNGGFTVFGSVIDDGMVDVMGEVVNLPIYVNSVAALSNSFAAIPVADYDVTGGEVLLQENLVMITSAASSITRPIVRFTPASVDFGWEVVGDPASSPVVIQLRNTGNEALDVNAVDVVAPYSIQSENCLNAVLDPVSISPTSSCTIELVFSRTTVGIFTDSVTVVYTGKVSGESFSVRYNSFGEVVPNTPALDVSKAALSFGNVADVGGTANDTLQILNRGGGALNIDAIDALTLGGVSPGEFSIDNTTGCAISGPLSEKQTCELSVNYNPIIRTVSEATIATLEIDTNGGVRSITLSGTHIPPQIEMGTNDAEVGYAQVGETILFQILATNIGLGGLVIENVSFTSADPADADMFARGSDVCPGVVSDGPLKGGESCGVLIEFMPTSPGEKSATMEIESNDPDNPTVFVTLKAGREPQISIIPASLQVDMGKAQIGQTIESIIIEIRNVAGPGLSVESISFEGADADVFDLQTTDCPGSVPERIDPNRPRLVTYDGTPFVGTCGIIVDFSPVAEGERTATLVIESNDPNNSIVNIALSARTDVTAIQVPATFDVVSEVNGWSTKRDLIVRNAGGAPLDISAVTGLGVSGLSQTNDCVTTIPAGGTCAITIKYDASALGQNSATLTIDSNDLVKPSVDIIVTGYGQRDSDGISDSAELAAPNQGDGNNDGVKDNLQNDVASFVAKGGKYVTLVSNDPVLALAERGIEASILDSVLLVDNIPAGAPVNTFFDYGLVAYKINVPFTPPIISAAEVVQVALYFPVDATPETYWRYGSTPDNPTPHWYDFTTEVRGSIGALIVGTVSIAAASGVAIERNMVILTFQDGSIGDDDLTVDGKIVHGVGGVSFNQQPPASAESAGSATYLWFTMLILMTRARRLRVENRRF